MLNSNMGRAFPQRPNVKFIERCVSYIVANWNKDKDCPTFKNGLLLPPYIKLGIKNR